MRPLKTFSTALAAIALVLTGCDNRTAPAPTPVQAPSVSPSALPSASAVASLEPASLTTCDPGQKIKVRWDVRRDFRDVYDVEVLTGAPGKETLFAAGGAMGDAETGPWALPGTHFLLRSKADGKELAQLTVGGPACPGNK